MSELIVQFGIIDKEMFENYVGKPMPDTVWHEVADELEGRVNNYIDALLQDLVEEYR